MAPLLALIFLEPWGAPSNPYHNSAGRKELRPFSGEVGGWVASLTTSRME